MASSTSGPTPAGSAADGPPTWGRTVRLAVSAALAFHLVGILVGPVSLPPALLADYLRRVYGPYIEAAYLDNAYKFFAPDPGPSHLIRWTAELPDGSRRQGLLPDRQRHWPRLFYHRHFMLAEFLAGQPDPAWDPDTPWEDLPNSELQRLLARSFAQHLLHKLAADSVTLELIEHALPNPEQVQQGLRLDDPSLYRSRKLGTYRRRKR